MALASLLVYLGSEGPIYPSIQQETDFLLEAMPRNDEMPQQAIWSNENIWYKQSEWKLA